MAFFIFQTLVLLTLSADIFAQEVTTTHGTVQGFRSVVLGQSIDTYYGIPFAKPPIGDLRFQNPVSADPWRPEVKDARSMQPSCYQVPFKPYGQPLRLLPELFSEDCLYLNIWVPSNIPAGTKLATMVWIYGGGFTSGSINSPLYNGKYIAANNNVILVSINYRVGVLGFLYLGPDSFPGNQGMMDQVLGLKWVNDNIEQFCGDRNMITIFGESAGAGSVGLHLLSPLSRDFFTRAILESGSPTADWVTKTRTSAKATTVQFATLANCSIASGRSMENCISQLPPETILQIQSMFNSEIASFPPVINGHFLTDDPSSLLRRGIVTKADILIGATKDEGTMFLVASDPNNFARDQFLSIVDMTARSLSSNPSLSKAVVAQYESTQIQSLRDPYIDIADDIVGDVLFKCPAVKLANQVSQWSNVYMYSFDHIIASLPLPEWMGVLHSYELEFVFGHPLGGNMTVTPEEVALTRAVMAYWTNFAKTGNPNQPNPQSTVWPRYDLTDDKYLVLDVGTNLKVHQGYRKHQCVFWHEIVPLILENTQTPSTTTLRYPQANSGMKINTRSSIFLVVIISIIVRLGYLSKY